MAILFPKKKARKEPRWLDRRIMRIKGDVQEELRERRESKVSARAAYYVARKEEQIKLARKKAVFEAGARERQLKARYAPRKQTDNGSPIKGSVFSMQPSNMMQPSNAMKPSYFASAKPKAIPKIMKTKKRKSKTKKTKYIIRGGIAYPTG